MATTSTRLENSDSARLRQGSPKAGHYISGWGKVCVALVIPLFFCLISFFLVDSRQFSDYADPVWVRASGQIYLSRNAKCDVVIYGDSTAITGVDPLIIEKASHLRTCNMAQSKGVLVVLGTTALDLYLKNNARPRYLILLFSGADFYKPQSWSDTTAYMEGVVPLLRFYPRGQFMHALLLHPEIFLGMMHYAYITGPMNLWRNRFRRPAQQQDPSTPIDVHFVRNVPASTNCSVIEDLDPLFHAPDPEFIRSIKSRYSPLADHLVVDASPASSCDPHLGYLAKAFSALEGASSLDNKLEAYPPSMFNEGYEHFTEQGAQRFSSKVASQIMTTNAGAQKSW